MSTITEPKAPEIRHFRYPACGGEVRAVTDGQTRKIEGYAAVFNSPSEPMWWGGVEIIRPGAFARALREKQDVRCVIDHGGATVLLGRTASGTLELREDAKGLWFSATLPDTQPARDVAALVGRQDINGCSFRFSVHRHPDGTGGVQWELGPDGKENRILLDLDLYDVGPVMEPAYPGTEVEIRSRQAIEEERRASRRGDRRQRLELAEANLRS